METIGNNDNGTRLRSTINANFLAMSGSFQTILDSDTAPTLISKLNANFAAAEQGGGDGEGGGDSSTTAYVNVKDYGAVGNGTTDDTIAMENAFEAAFAADKAVYVPSGTYLIRRSLTLKSGMEVYGDGATSVIKKKAAVWHTLTVQLDKNTNVVTLDSVSGLEVGDAMYVSDFIGTQTPYVYNGAGGARDCSYGVITAIDTANNTVTFDSLVNHDEGYSGAVKDHPAGCVLSAPYAVLRSWSKYPCVNVFIHDICLDGNRQSGEPTSWCNGCIHFDPRAGKRQDVLYPSATHNHFVVNCRLINSSFDAISDQGDGGLLVSGCTIENPRIHGVHMGTTFAGAVIMNNTMTGSSTTIGAGVFYCQAVTDVVVYNNRISTFNHGCSDEEYGSAGKFTVIRKNTFTNITSYVFDFSRATSGNHGVGIMVIENTVVSLKSGLFNGKYLDNVIIANNTVSSVSTVPDTFINLDHCNNAIVTNNSLPSGTSIATYVNTTSTTNIINNDNSWN